MTDVILEIARGSFSRGRRLSVAELDRLPERIGAALRDLGSPMPLIDLGSELGATSKCRVWLQPRLLDFGETFSILDGDVECGAVQGSTIVGTLF